MLKKNERHKVQANCLLHISHSYFRSYAMGSVYPFVSLPSVCLSLFCLSVCLSLGPSLFISFSLSLSLLYMHVCVSRKIQWICRKNNCACWWQTFRTLIVTEIVLVLQLLTIPRSSVTVLTSNYLQMGTKNAFNFVGVAIKIAKLCQIII